jgi:hypothetical protein
MQLFPAEVRHILNTAKIILKKKCFSLFLRQLLRRAVRRVVALQALQRNT